MRPDAKALSRRRSSPIRLPLPAFARTTTFRLALLYVAVFTVFAAAVLAYVYVSTVGYMRYTTEARVNAEVDSIQRAYRDGGLERVSQALIERASAPDAYFYYQLSTPNGLKLSGAFSHMPRSGIGRVEFEFESRRGDEVRIIEAEGRIVKLGDEALLLVAFDLGERREITQRITTAVWTAAGAVLVLSLIGGYFVSRSVSRRADELASTAEAVMAGDLSRRVPERGANDEFDRLAERMNAMLDRLERLVKASRHAGDAIAHDLRSPLSRLRNRLETALSQPLDDNRAQAALGETLDEVDRVLATFNAILRLSRVDARTEGRMVRIDVSEVVAELADLFEPAAEAAGLDFTANPGHNLMVLCDRDLIAQALSNLIDNAIKYTPEGGAIAVRARRGDNMVELSVVDSGPGIPEADRDRAVERFVRMDAARTHPGSGLGLALVDAVAEVHRGELLLLDGDGPPERPGLRAVLRLPRA